MTSLFVWVLVSALLIVGGGAMVWADRRRGRLRAIERARAEHAARETRLAVRENLFEPRPRHPEE